MKFQEIGLLVIVATTATVVMANGTVQTLTGEVSDSMCGAST